MSEQNHNDKAPVPSVDDYFQRIAASEQQRAEAEKLKAVATQELIKQCDKNVVALAKFGLRYEFREVKRRSRAKSAEAGVHKEPSNTAA